MTDPSDMKASIARVESDVSHLGEKLDLMHDGVVKLLDNHQGRLNNHADRLKSGEIRWARQKGAMGVFTAIAAVAGSFIVYIRS